MNLDLVGTLPLVGRLSALGRVGVTSAKTTGSFRSTGAARVPYADATTNQRSTQFKVGAGLMYDLTDSLALRLEAERHRIQDSVGNKGHVDSVSLGLIYRFGASPAPVARVSERVAEPIPVSIAPAPAPAPIVAAAPTAPTPAPARQRFTLSADSLFDFDQSTVRPAGKQALDKLAADLKGGQYDGVRVIGHTDRLGSPKYNAQLSTRRAQAVGTYLARFAGISASTIKVEGRGEDAPETKQGDCRGSAATPRLVACLQPDRRVEVEVTATR